MNKMTTKLIVSILIAGLTGSTLPPAAVAAGQIRFANDGPREVSFVPSEIGLARPAGVNTNLGSSAIGLPRTAVVDSKAAAPAAAHEPAAIPEIPTSAAAHPEAGRQPSATAALIGSAGAVARGKDAGVVLQEAYDHEKNPSSASAPVLAGQAVRSSGLRKVRLGGTRATALAASALVLAINRTAYAGHDLAGNLDVPENQFLFVLILFPFMTVALGLAVLAGSRDRDS